MYTRGLKHMANYQGKQKDSLLWRHAQMEHDGSLKVNFSMKVVKAFTDPLREASKIKNRLNLGHCPNLPDLPPPKLGMHI